MSAITAALLLFLSSLTFTADEEPALKTSSEKLSYALGLEIGANLKGLPTAIDLPIFLRGLEDSFTGNKPLLTAEQAAEAREELSGKIREERIRQMQELAEKNRKVGAAFLAENGKKEGVRTTGSGLQYTVLREGDGQTPEASDQVRVHYRGTLIDGTEFDSSHKRGEPATFSVGGVIAGWTEGLQLMTVGSRYRLFIPSELAYGERGSRGKIGPNETLIFEVELLAIEE